MKKIVLAFLVLISLSMKSQLPVFQWVKEVKVGYDGTMVSGFVSSISAKTDAFGNVFTIGVFQGIVDFNPGSAGDSLFGASGSDDIFILKQDAAGGFLWAKKIGASGSDIAYDIALDSAGNIYIAGSFQSAVDFDPGSGMFNMTAGGADDMFFEKLDNNGNFLWAKQMGTATWGTCFERVRAIATDVLGNIYLAGGFCGSQDFDPDPSVYTLTSSGFDDIFVAKYSSSGNFIWAKQAGGSDEDVANALIVNNTHIYLTGGFAGTADFDPSVGINNITSNGYFDVFILKFDFAGNVSWVKTFGGGGNDQGWDLTLDQSENLYTVGDFQDTADFDPGAGIMNLADTGIFMGAFISKLEQNGNFIWAKSFTGDQYCQVKSVSTDVDNNVYTTGFWTGTVDFDPGPTVALLTENPTNEIFLSRLDSLGNYVWILEMGGNGSDWGYSVEVNQWGNIYMTGGFQETADLDPGTGVVTSMYTPTQDCFVLKLSGMPAGLNEVLWQNRMILVYPNPTTNNLTIRTTKPTNILIVNLLGQELFNSKIEKSETIDVSFLSNGIYFVKDLNNGGSVKFVKQ